MSREVEEKRVVYQVEKSENEVDKRDEAERHDRLSTFIQETNEKIVMNAGLLISSSFVSLASCEGLLNFEPNEENLERQRLEIAYKHNVNIYFARMEKIVSELSKLIEQRNTDFANHYRDSLDKLMDVPLNTTVQRSEKIGEIVDVIELNPHKRISVIYGGISLTPRRTLCFCSDKEINDLFENLVLTEKAGIERKK